MKYTIGTLILAIIGLGLLVRPEKETFRRERHRTVRLHHAPGGTPARASEPGNKGIVDPHAAVKAEIRTIERQIAVVERQLEDERGALSSARATGKITSRGMKVDGLYQQLRALHLRRGTLEAELYKEG
ncbi:hypothetical protein DES53_106129 [Roseimicrobium gellanilyticum]|uniref:Uncharacterized protein n=1 Tax=Roseimicrobium gellanilyticum TaxID=748857 RepID=A0A366HKY5_9BACT|nr:hypothetical protein [Roseimicrobium gellanilyticum]RBP42423.1 hypothetical protein DES53_106129 [Roseimicrobium gellanilyticum]